MIPPSVMRRINPMPSMCPSDGQAFPKAAAIRRFSKNDARRIASARSAKAASFKKTREVVGGIVSATSRD
jgi:hypothetical protein